MYIYKKQIEDAFSRQKEEEERNRKAEAQKREQERLDAIKRKEQKRILEVSFNIIVLMLHCLWKNLMK